MGVPSNMLELGTVAPDFSLPDAVSGKTISLSSVTGTKGLLVMFLCPHCPYVKHVQKVLATMLDEYAGASFSVIGINSNDVKQYPEDGPEGMRSQAAEAGFEFPYCYDESQEV